jgi:hypothetical protein
MKIYLNNKFQSVVGGKLARSVLPKQRKKRSAYNIVVVHEELRQTRTCNGIVAESETKSDDVLVARFRENVGKEFVQEFEILSAPNARSSRVKILH